MGRVLLPAEQKGMCLSPGAGKTGMQFTGSEQIYILNILYYDRVLYHGSEKTNSVYERSGLGFDDPFSQKSSELSLAFHRKGDILQNPHAQLYMSRA